MTSNTVHATHLPSASRSPSAQRITTPPRNWPPNLPYLSHPQHSPFLTPAQIIHLHTPPSPTAPSPTISLPSHPNPALAITPITHPAHPAHPQHGLFATAHLPAGSLICLYLGRVHSGSAQDTDAQSDYDISLSRTIGAHAPVGDGGLEEAEEQGIGIDAARAGNESRFVNDFRGVRPKGSSSGEGPNAEFRDVWMECGRGGGREGERGIGIFVLPAGRSGKRKAGIRAGEEVLVSYGRGFWENRRPSTEDGVEGGDG